MQETTDQVSGVKHMIESIDYILRNTPSPQANIFRLDHPEKYQCFVYQLYAGHKGMTICGSRKATSETTYMSFTVTLAVVTHFDGPLRWTGANFCLASIQSYQNFVQTYSKKQLRSVESWSCLLEVPTDDCTIRIAGTPYVGIRPYTPWDKPQANE